MKMNMNILALHRLQIEKYPTSPLAHEKWLFFSNLSQQRLQSLSSCVAPGKTHFDGAGGSKIMIKIA